MVLLIFVPLIYFLTVVQNTFAVFFDFRGYILNLVFIAVLIFNIFESPRKITGLVLAIFAGFLLDIFSSGIFGANFIGFWTFVLFILSIFIKYFFRTWIHISIIK